MKKVLKRSLSLLLAITIIFSSAYVGLSEVDFGSLFAVEAKAATSGTTGDCTWSLNGTVLTISGNGAMGANYSSAPLWGTSITEVVIENGVTMIGYMDFKNCTSLESITIPNSVTSIDSGAFAGCTSLTSITIPNSITSIDSSAFASCTSLTSITIPNSVTSIDTRTFKNCTSLTSITIPDSVTSIGYAAFENCTSLTSITIPNSVTSIGNYAFRNCTNLTSISVDLANESYCSADGVLFDKNKTVLLAYPNGKKDTYYAIPNGVISIGEYAFCNCTSIASITIPDSVTNIGVSVFTGCSNLKSISVDLANECYCSVEGVLFNKDETVLLAYPNGKKDTYYAIPNGVISIGEYAFSNCTNLTSITIPDSITSIGNYTFDGCTGLKGVYITDLSAWCNIDFSYDLGYAYPGAIVYYDSNPLTYANKLYLNGELITALEIPEEVVEIKPFAFTDCEFTSVTIPDSMEYIGMYCFRNNSELVSVKFGKNVKNVGCDAFEKCTKISHVYYSGTVGDWKKINFEYYDQDGALASVTANPAWYSKSFVCGNQLYEITYTNHGFYWEQNINCIEYCLYYHENIIWDIVVNPTCDKNGLKHKVCEGCFVIFETVTIPANGHTSSNWIIGSNATASAPGTKYKKCTVCGTKLETATIPQLKPTTPKATTTNEIGGVNVTWNNVAGAIKYNVYRRLGGSSTWTLIGTTTGNTLLDKNVKSGIYYVYSVRAYNAQGKYSDFVSANTQTRKYMATPKLTTIYNHANGLAIKWNAVAGVTNGYRVYRRGAGSTYWTYLGTTKNLYFIDNAVKNKSGEYFRYTVIADGGYHSKFDTTGLYLRRLANPTLNSATSSTSGITVKWGAVKGTTGYYVYRKTANSTWVRVGTVGGTNNTTFLDKTARKGTTYTYTVKAVYGATTSAYNSGISCYDKY